MLVWNTNSTNYTIPGHHGEVVASCPQVPMAEKYLWGLHGSVVILGRKSVRDLSVEIWLGNPDWANASQLYNWIDGTLDATLVGTYGSLTLQTDTDSYWPVHQQQIFTNMLFLSYTPLPFEGQSRPSAIYDEGATLYTSGSKQGSQSWLMRMELAFRQTIPDRTVV